MTTFKSGMEIEVFDIKREVWIPATIVLAWKGVDIDIDTNKVEKQVECYDVEGRDNLGPFSGRWGLEYIRAKQKRGREPARKPRALPKDCGSP